MTDVVRPTTGFAQPRPTHPFEFLLSEVSRCAGNVAWLEGKISRLPFDELLLDEEQANPSGWVKLYQSERQKGVRASEVAIRAGIAERHVRIAETQTQDVVMIIRATLSEIGCTPEQQAQASVVMRRLFGELAAARRMEIGSSNGDDGHPD
jgi:hypothetical protein